jgi:hypothetical protein
MLLEAPVRWWRCPSCDLTDRTQQAEVHTQMHPCPALGGLNVPLVEVPDPDAKPKGRHVPVMAEDYVGPDGRLRAVRTERTDGSNDVTVFPKPALGTIS